MGKPTLPWFKFFQDAWLKGTRDLTPNLRGIYIDCLCLMYEADGPLRDDDYWISHRLHIQVRKWRDARKALVDAGKLTETPDGLINSRANSEIVERSSVRAGKSVAASKRAEENRVQPKLPFENNKSKVQLRLLNGGQKVQEGLHARASSDHQSQKEEEKIDREQAEAVLLQGSMIDEDDPYNKRKDLDPLIAVRMHERIGAERTEHILRVYFRSEYARNARFVDKAFPRWLETCYRERISDDLTPKELAAEIIAMCGGDTALPKVPPKIRTKAP